MTKCQKCNVKAQYELYQKRHIGFNIKHDDFVKLYHSPCLLCLKSNALNLIKIDPKIGYESFNTCSICSNCVLKFPNRIPLSPDYFDLITSYQPLYVLKKIENIPVKVGKTDYYEETSINDNTEFLIKLNQLSKQYQQTLQNTPFEQFIQSASSIILKSEISREAPDHLLISPVIINVCTYKKCRNSFKAYWNSKGIAKRCWPCFYYDKIRDRTGRDTLEYERNGRNHEQREIYRQENHQTIIEYSQNFRIREKIKLGLKEYIRQNTISHTNWYNNQSEEKKEEMNQINKNNPNIRLGSLKLSAKKRKIIWNLTDEYGLSMINSLCTYCGSKTNGACNSIDRIDNTIGYEIGNVCTCCEMCNFIKCDLSIEHFIQGIINILLHLEIIENGEIETHTFKDIDNGNKITTTYNTWCTKQKYKGHKVSINKSDYDLLCNGICYLCGFNSAVQCIGIDRFDSKIDYELSNCRSCCKICNYMKNNYNYETFINKLTDIYNNYII